MPGAVNPYYCGLNLVTPGQYLRHGVEDGMSLYIYDVQCYNERRKHVTNFEEFGLVHDPVGLAREGGRAVQKSCSTVVCFV